MSEDCLKLTTYFGERDRAGGRLLADALLDLYGRRELRASVLLRGAEGFGRLHALRTDRLLSLSEALPVVATAVDTTERIEAVLDEVSEIASKGVVTLERARMVAGCAVSDGGRATGDSGSAPGDRWRAMGGVTGATGPGGATRDAAAATKLTVYLGRRQRIGGRPAFVAVCELLQRCGVAGASVLLGVDGTRDGRRQRARFLSRNAEVPTIVLAVGGAEQVARAVRALESELQGPLVTFEQVRICKRDGQRLHDPHEPPSHDAHGRPLWQKLTVYSSHDALHDGVPLHLAIATALLDGGAAGATCVRGVWGFHGDHEPHGERLLRLRRGVPVLTIAIDAPERIGDAFAAIDAITSEHGLVTSELVPAVGVDDGNGDGAKPGPLALP